MAAVAFQADRSAIHVRVLQLSPLEKSKKSLDIIARLLQAGANSSALECGRSPTYLAGC